jgi:2-phosphoglycolate phosphatase
MQVPIDLVMFDLDGTLADTGRDLADAVNYTRARFELPSLPDAMILTHVGRGVEHMLYQTLPETAPGRFDAVLKIFVERYGDHLLDATALYPGVHKTLESLRPKRRAVVSNKLERFTVAVLRGLGVEDCFDLILGGDSVSRKKPDPEPLRYVLTQLAVPAERAVIVGDGYVDIEAGKCAGVFTCGVTYGMGRKQDLLAAGPSFMIDRIVDLTRFIV